MTVYDHIGPRHDDGDLSFLLDPHAADAAPSDDENDGLPTV